jgi:hypothetical protein
MELNDLLLRAQELQQQLANNKQAVNALTEQLEYAKAEFHTTNGRIQEIIYLVDVEKGIQKAKADEAARLVAEHELKLKEQELKNEEQ